MSHDYSEFTTPKDMGEGLAKLSEMADEQVRRELVLAKADKAAALAKEELRQISEEAIPELMMTMGIETFKTTSGITINVKETIRASVLKATEAAAFAWLRANGHAALIKRKVALQFGMGDDELAQATLDKLEGLDVEDKSSVHSGTLAKFVREQLEEGTEVPEDLFSIHKQRVSKVKVS